MPARHIVGAPDAGTGPLLHPAPFGPASAGCPSATPDVRLAARTSARSSGGSLPRWRGLIDRRVSGCKPRRMVGALMCRVGVHSWVKVYNEEGKAYLTCRRCRKEKDTFSMVDSSPYGGF